MLLLVRSSLLLLKLSKGGLSCSVVSLVLGTYGTGTAVVALLPCTVSFTLSYPSCTVSLTSSTTSAVPRETREFRGYRPGNNNSMGLSAGKQQCGVIGRETTVWGYRPGNNSVGLSREITTVMGYRPGNNNSMGSSDYISLVKGPHIKWTGFWSRNCELMYRLS